MFENHMLLAGIIFVVTYIFIIWDRFDMVIVSLSGALAMILLNLLSQQTAYGLIDLETLGLLISTMIMVIIAEKTGLFEYLAIKTLKMAKGEPWKALIYLSLITAVLSAILNNVTIILLMMPIAIDTCKRLKIDATAFVIGLVFASNVGGTATLIGDPPNILIGVRAGLNFLDFLKNLAPIIAIITAVSALFFVIIYRKSLVAEDKLKSEILSLNEDSMITNKPLLIKTIAIISLTVIGFVYSGFTGKYDASTISLFGSIVLLIISGVEVEDTLKKIEWSTIFFFVGLFILVGGIERAHLLEKVAELIKSSSHNDLTLLTHIILFGSAFASAFVNNIPYALTMIPVIKDIGKNLSADYSVLWWALALGSCLGGNGTLIGASANVVAAGIAEDEGYKLTFGKYFKVAFPLMLLTIGICAIYLQLRYL